MNRAWFNTETTPQFTVTEQTAVLIVGKIDGSLKKTKQVPCYDIDNQATQQIQMHSHQTNSSDRSVTIMNSIHYTHDCGSVSSCGFIFFLFVLTRKVYIISNIRDSVMLG